MHVAFPRSVLPVDDWEKTETAHGRGIRQLWCSGSCSIVFCSNNKNTIRDRSAEIMVGQACINMVFYMML